jgi:hypothetical protein
MIRSFTITNPHQIYEYQLNVWARGEISTEFWWENLKETGYLEHLVVTVNILTVWIINK